MCNFCEKEQSIEIKDANNNYYFSLPISSCSLLITDKKRNREYIYGITYCPICGKKLFNQL
mgnify:CR=1 FL=1